MDRYRVRPGKPVDLSEAETHATDAHDGDRAEAEAELDRLHARIAELQDVLYAQHEHRVLVVFQATDTGGKDGAIRHVFRDVDPIGIRMASFKVPSDIEKDHDYLWRVHQQVPRTGELVVFNRSHYEDVLVVRVHEWVSESQVAKRFGHIRDFERMLADEGTTIVKFFLHISKDEQRERLQARVDDPDKQWKFSLGDIEERKHWKKYQKAYEEAINETSTEDAPWYVVPAGRKWYRNLVVAQIMVDTLESLDLRYPEPQDDLDGLVVE